MGYVSLRVYHMHLSYIQSRKRVICGEIEQDVGTYNRNEKNIET